MFMTIEKLQKIVEILRPDWKKRIGEFVQAIEMTGGNPGSFCPLWFGGRTEPSSQFPPRGIDHVHDIGCFLCRDAVGLDLQSSWDYETSYPGSTWCPCHKLGCEEALKRTRLYLEKEE